MELLLSNESSNIISACIEVQRHLGCGFLEPVYQEALEIEFSLRGIPFEREKELLIDYKGHLLQKKYYADFVCYGNIILELKAVSEITPAHVSQVYNYLSATHLPLGLIINFAVQPLKPRRIILQRPKNYAPKD